MPITISKTNPYDFCIGSEKFSPYGITRFSFPTTDISVKEFIEKMASSGINTLRMVIPGELERGIEPELGKYNEEFLHNTDEIFEIAQANGINIVLCLFDSSSFYAPWVSNTWKYGVYSTKFTGVKELFTNMELRKYMKDRIKFLLNHFSKYSNVFAWEVMNEMNKIGDLYGKDKCKDITMEWYADMAKYIKEIDPNHLVTGSLYGDEVWNVLNESKYNDFIQIHTYKEDMNPENIEKIISDYCKENMIFEKPVVISEFASKKNNPNRNEFVRNGILSAKKENCSAWLYADTWNVDERFGMGYGDMNDELFNVYKETY